MRLQLGMTQQRCSTIPPKGFAQHRKRLYWGGRNPDSLGLRLERRRNPDTLRCLLNLLARVARMRARLVRRASGIARRVAKVSRFALGANGDLCVEVKADGTWDASFSMRQREPLEPMADALARTFDAEASTLMDIQCRLWKLDKRRGYLEGLLELLVADSLPAPLRRVLGHTRDATVQVTLRYRGRTRILLAVGDQATTHLSLTRVLTFGIDLDSPVDAEAHVAADTQDEEI